MFLRVNFYLATTIACVLLTTATAAEPTADSLAASVRGTPSVVATLHFGKLWNGPERDAVRSLSETHPVVPSWWLKDLKAQVGIAAETVERVSLVVHPVPSGIGVPGRNITAIITTVDAKSADTLVDKLLGPSEEKQLDGRTVRESTASGAKATRLSERVVLYAPDRSHTLSTFSGDAKPDPAWQAFLAEVDGAVLLAAQGRIDLLAPPLAAVDATHPLAPLAKAQMLQLWISAEAKILRIVLRGQFADAEAAAKAAAVLKTFPPVLNGYIQMAATEMPKFLTAQKSAYPRAEELGPVLTAAVEAAGKALAQAEPKVDGATAELAFDLETDRPATTALALLTLLPRAAKR